MISKPLIVSFGLLFLQVVADVVAIELRESPADKATGAAENDPNIISVSNTFAKLASVYLLTNRNVTFSEAKATCIKHGGYLVEINSEEEYLFIQNYLTSSLAKLPDRIFYIVTGAFFDANSDWQLLTNTGDPIYTGHWARDEPHLFNSQYNQLLLVKQGDTWLMADGTKDVGKAGLYLCEVKVSNTDVLG